MKLLITLLFTSAIFCQVTDTTSSIESKTEKKIVETPKVSIEYLKMLNRIDNLSLSGSNMFYSDLLINRELLNSANNDFTSEKVMLHPLRYELAKNSKWGSVQEVLQYALYGAAAYALGAHLKKYWNEYKKDFFGK